MKKSEIEPRCEYCQRSYFASSSGQLSCKKKKAAVESDDFCKKFKYDPIKRVPKKIKLNLDFSPEEFDIDL